MQHLKYSALPSIVQLNKVRPGNEATCTVDLDWVGQRRHQSSTLHTGRMILDWVGQGWHQSSTLHTHKENDSWLGLSDVVLREREGEGEGEGGEGKGMEGGGKERGEGKDEGERKKPGSNSRLWKTPYHTISILWKVSGTLSLVGASVSDCTSVTEYPLLLPGTHPVILEEAHEELSGIL